MSVLMPWTHLSQGQHDICSCKARRHTGWSLSSLAVTLKKLCRDIIKILYLGTYLCLIPLSNKLTCVITVSLYSMKQENACDMSKITFGGNFSSFLSSKQPVFQRVKWRYHFTKVYETVRFHFRIPCPVRWVVTRYH